MNLSAKDLIKALEANGFEFKRSKGSLEFITTKTQL